MGGTSLPPPPEAAAATGSDEAVSEMMGRLRLTAVETEAVVLDDGVDDAPVHSPWALVGKVLAPNTLHISTIAAALRPAWGNPRGLLLNPAGENRFVAEFASKADKNRVLDGPPWVVGKHAVLLKEFNIDLKPKDMVFNGMKVWARIINLPFGYMHKRWGAKIAGSLGIEGSIPVVDCDATGRCWGSFMRVRVEVDVDKLLWRGITVFSQRRNATEWYEVQYEHLPHYYFSCGIVGHSSVECKNPGERDVEGKLPYSADRLVAPDERKKRPQGTNSSSGSVSAGQGNTSSQTNGENPAQPVGKSAAANTQSKHGEPEVSSPVKKKQPRPRTNTAKTKGQSKDIASGVDERGVLSRQKRKTQQYRVKTPAEVEPTPGNPLALVIHHSTGAKEGPVERVEEELSSDSNKKLRKSGDGSADQAGTVDQTRQTQC
jgi:hypothetical protein